MIFMIIYYSVSQLPGRGPIPDPGRERSEETTVCYKISLVQLITNLNVILYLSNMTHIIHKYTNNLYDYAIINY